MSQELTEVQQQQVTTGLMPKLAERQELINTYNQVIKLEMSEENSKQFRELRLALVKNRSAIGEWKTKEKAFYLAGGNFIQATYNKEIAVNKDMEAKLLEGEQYAIRMEAERLEKIRHERWAKLSKFVENEPAGLSTMDQMVFDSLLLGSESTYNNRIEAEKKAEAERLEGERKRVLYQQRKEELLPYWDFLESESKKIEFGNISKDSYILILDEVQVLKQQHESKQKAIQEENERLKAEAVKKENERKKEKEALENKLSIEKDKRRMSAIKFLLENGFEATHGGHNATDYPHFIGALHYSEFDKDSELEAFKDGVLTYKSKVKQEAENNRLQAELKAKQEAENKAKAEAERIAEAERVEAENKAKAPIKEQLTSWVDGFELPTLSTPHEKASEIITKHKAFKKWAKTEIEKI